MAGGSLITEEMKRMMGTESKPSVVEIDKTVIKRLAEAIGDPNPLWQDEEYARKSKFGGIIAPPALAITEMMMGERPPEPEVPLKRALDGGGKWEFFKPIKVGDVITITSKITDYFEKEGSVGKMLFTIWETTRRNQRGELVARSWVTRIRY